MNLFYRFIRVFSKVALKIAFKMEYEGLENIPEGGGYLVCANHRTMLDPFFFAYQFKPQLFFMAKAELFRNKIFGALLRNLGAFPVKRGTADIGAIKESLKIIGSDGRLLLFPEGTRNSTDGAKAGAGMLALRSDCAVLPVYVTPGRKPFRRVRVVVGEAFHPEKPEGKPGSEDYQNTADEILRRIYALETVK
jgi:1-acyl-sn-glycerol-3-phosphate acyltransferase